MLVLSRKITKSKIKPGQDKIHIGDDVVITIIDVKGSAVKVGIEAPREIKILRGELVETADDDQQTKAA